MITRTLISALEKAQDPRAVRAITWLLEKSTGFDTTAVSEWYQRNGFYRIGGFSAGPTWTGKIINRDTVLECTAFYAGVRLISEDLGSLPFHTYERSRDRSSIEKAYTHPLYRTLHDLTNPEVSAGEFVEALTAHALITADGFADIQRMDSGTYLWPWQPGEVRLARNQAGALVYLRKEGNSAEKTYARDQVFHLKGFTLDTRQGDDPLKRFRQALGITLAADEYAGRYYANDATPGIVLKRPAGSAHLEPPQITAIKEAWKKWFQGVRHSHEVAVLQDGMEAQQLAPNAEQSQLLGTRKNQVIEVCRMLRLQPHKLAELDRATNNNIEQQAIEYVTNTLNPWRRRWRDSVYRCLLTVDEQIAGRVWAEMDVAGLQSGDFATQSEGFRKLLEKGVYSINEVRRWLNMNPVTGGDEHFIQLNMATVQDIAAGATLPSASLVPVGKAAVAPVPQEVLDLPSEIKTIYAEIAKLQLQRARRPPAPSSNSQTREVKTI